MKDLDPKPKLNPDLPQNMSLSLCVSVSLSVSLSLCVPLVSLCLSVSSHFVSFLPSVSRICRARHFFSPLEKN